MAAASEMRRRLDIPVMVDNDANLGALAEAAFGAGRDAGDMIYLKVSSGIGAGLILNGRLYRGSAGPGRRARPRARRPGRHRLPVRQPRLPGDLAATGALVDCLRRSHGDGLHRRRRCSRPRGTATPACRRVIADAGRALGQVVVTLLNVLNPEMLVVGGDLAAAGDLLLDGVRESVARAALPAAAARPARGGGARERAQVLGALALVVSEADRAFPTRLAMEAA